MKTDLRDRLERNLDNENKKWTQVLRDISVIQVNESHGSLVLSITLLRSPEDKIGTNLSYRRQKARTKSHRLPNR